MSIVSQVKDALESERRSGKTYQEIANLHRMNQSHVVNLINGKREWGGISLDSFDRMFPRAQIDLNSGTPPDHFHAIVSDAPGLPGMRARMISKVLGIQMPPAAMLEVIRVISETV